MKDVLGIGRKHLSSKMNNSRARTGKWQWVPAGQASACFVVQNASYCSFLISALFSFVCVCVCVRARAHVCVSACVSICPGEQVPEMTWKSDPIPGAGAGVGSCGSPMWVLGTKAVTLEIQ